MSDYQGVDRFTFLLDGEEKLGADYDEFADVLYLWRSGGPTAAISITATEGHLVRIDPETGDLVGFTIFGWDGQLHRTGPIRVTVPVIGKDADNAPRAQPQTHSLELIPA